MAPEGLAPKAAPCRCACGYRCGGPGRCSLGVFKCLAQPEGHFVVDCEHDWSGPPWESEDGCMSSVTCANCGATSIGHDMRFGP